MSFQIVIRTPQLDMKTLLIFEELLNALDLSLQPIEFLVLVDVVFLPFIQFGLPLALSLQFWVRCENGSIAPIRSGFGATLSPSDG